MSLKELAVDGRYSGNMYKILERYLTSNVGKPWDELYSYICSVASSRTYLGTRIREAVNSLVDVVRKDYRYFYPDFYVDDAGLLQKCKKLSRSQRNKRDKKSMPVTTIRFTEDGSTYYTLAEVHDGPVASKYTKVRLAWFKMELRIVSTTRPINDIEIPFYIKTGQPVKKGKKTHYIEYKKETWIKSQVGGKLLLDLKMLASKRRVPKPYKIVKIAYSSGNSYRFPETKDYATIYVSGTTKEKQ